MEDNNITTVQMTKQTRARLESVGKKGETYDQLINRLIDFLEGKG